VGKGGEEREGGKGRKKGRKGERDLAPQKKNPGTATAHSSWFSAGLYIKLF